MSAQPTLCSYFDTPEGRWSLVSEFTTEDAANQFVPHISRDAHGDDLGFGSPNNHTSYEPPTTTISPSSGLGGGMRFGTGATAMVSAGIMFGGGSADSRSQLGAISQPQQSPNRLLSGSQQQFVMANRPTHVSVFGSYLPANGNGSTTGISSESALAASTAATAVAGASNSQGTGNINPFRSLATGAPASNGSSAVPGTGASTHGKGIVTKSTSAYVGRLITNENLARYILSDKAQQQSTTNFVFNAPRCLSWVGLQPDNHAETLARFDLVGNTPLCHDINQTTRTSSNRLDIVMGMVQGNIIWYDAISGKYSRLNKNSGYTPAIMCVKWLPESDNLFMVGTFDGCVMIMDRAKDDFYLPKLPTASTNNQSNSTDSSRRFNDVQSLQLSLDTFEVASANALRAKSNPVSYWKLSNKPITSISFAPSVSSQPLVAITGEDGGLRIINYLEERHIYTHPSFFAGLTCCAWSDDAKYIVAGGKDDLLTIWSTQDHTLVARCEGHESWVQSIVFDPLGHEDEGTFRFMSIGEDSKLLVWDFSMAALHRPKISINGLNSSNVYNNGQKIGKRMPRDSVPVLQPLVSTVIHDAALSDLVLTQDFLVTACRRGVIKIWKRPATFDLSVYI